MQTIKLRLNKELYTAQALRATLAAYKGVCPIEQKEHPIYHELFFTSDDKDVVLAFANHILSIQRSNSP